MRLADQRISNMGENGGVSTRDEANLDRLKALKLMLMISVDHLKNCPALWPGRPPLRGHKFLPGCIDYLSFNQDQGCTDFIYDRKLFKRYTLTLN